MYEAGKKITVHCAASVQKYFRSAKSRLVMHSAYVEQKRAAHVTKQEQYVCLLGFTVLVELLIDVIPTKNSTLT